MQDDASGRNAWAPEPSAIARAQAIYTPFTLSLYDLVVHGLSNRLAWHCPTSALLELYRQNLSFRHLEAGVGTGLLLDQAGRSEFERLLLLDINRNPLRAAGRRLARFAPELWQQSLFDTIEAKGETFHSIGLTYVLHCLPGPLGMKLAVLDRLRPVMAEGAVLFGATILGCGIAPNHAARVLLALYNKKGVFNNRNDDFAALEQGLRQRFATVELEQKGCVALFRAA